MITEHIELPDPTKFRGDVNRYHDGIKYRIATYEHDDAYGDCPRVLASVDTADEADRIVAELRIRMRVAATLLGLEPKSIFNRP